MAAETHDLDALAQADNFAHLVMASVRLLVPQSDIHTLEPVADMRPAVGHSGSVGQFELGETVWPAYALSTDLTPAAWWPEAYRIAVLMWHGQRAYGVLCEQVSLIGRGQIVLHPVPACMRRPLSPLLALARHGNEVLYVSSAQALERSFREVGDE